MHQGDFEEFEKKFESLRTDIINFLDKVKKNKKENKRPGLMTNATYRTLIKRINQLRQTKKGYLVIVNYEIDKKQNEEIAREQKIYFDRVEEALNQLSGMMEKENIIYEPKLKKGMSRENKDFQSSIRKIMRGLAKDKFADDDATIFDFIQGWVDSEGEQVIMATIQKIEDQDAELQDVVTIFGDWKEKFEKTIKRLEAFKGSDNEEKGRNYAILLKSAWNNLIDYLSPIMEMGIGLGKGYQEKKTKAREAVQSLKVA